MNNNQIFCNYVYAEDSEADIEQELQQVADKIINDIDFSSIDVEIQSSQFDFSLLENKTIKEFVNGIVNGEIDISIESVFKYFLRISINFLKQIFVPLTSVFIVILLASLFNNLRGKKITGVSEIVYLICFAVVVIILSSLISKVISNSRQSIITMQSQMNTLFPIIITLMTSLGAVTSAGAYSPTIAFLSLIVSKIFIYILLPLFTLSFILSIIGNFSKNAKLDKFNSFIKSLFKWIMGSVCTIFVAYLSVKSLVSASHDGLRIKATKYAIKNYIPMLGGYISEGFEVVKAGSFIVKNAVGFVGLLLIVSVCVGPVIMIAVTQMGIKLLSGIVEFVGDAKSGVFLQSVASSLKLLVAIVIGVALMYFFTIYLMISSLSGIF